MASLLTQIQSCDNCNLCKNMTVSPIATEIIDKNPKLLIVIGTSVTLENDITQEVLTGVNKKLLEKVVRSIKIPYALTFQVKCKSENLKYKKGDYKVCGEWLKKEIEWIKPRIIVGMGKFPYSDIKFDLITDSPNSIFVNKKRSEEFKTQLEAVINDFP